MSPPNQQGGSHPVSRQKQAISELAQRGDFPDALKLCTTLCEQSPGDPEAWFLLGAINGAVSDYPQAEICCKKAVALAPDHAMLRFNLGIALLRQEKAVESIGQFEHAIAIQPEFPDAYRELGNAQSMNKDYLAAIASYTRSADLDPASSATQYNMGNAFLGLERLDDAANAFQKVIELQPDYVEAYYGYATALIRKYRFDAAIEFLKGAVGRLPDASLLSLLAVAHQEQGDADVALEYYERALSVDPELVDARVGIAGVLAFQGRYTEAGEILESLLASNPESTTVKTTYTTFAHHFGAADKAIEIAEHELSGGEAPARTKAKFHFSLGQLYERKGDLDKAFGHYACGNNLRGARFDYVSYERMFHAIMDYYSPAALDRLPRSGNTTDKLIFIVGMPRSGTSLAEQILASHPDVFGAGELGIINSMVDKIRRTLDAPEPYPLCLDRLTTGTLGQLADQYLENTHRRSKGAAGHFTDKMPANFMHLGFISLLFPNAKIVHCTRDPRDTCLSCYFKLFSGEQPYTYSLTDLAGFYRLYKNMMDHWGRVLSAPIYELNYENVVENQEDETRKLVEFCGLDWSDACLNFHKTDRTVATASHDQVREPIYTRSVGRWRAYEKHLGPLLDTLRLDA